jgi:GMP synthase-like glutamine amidotransferase
MKPRILLISTCSEKLHELEFVRPVEEILNGFGIESFVRKFNEVKKKDLRDFDKVIICGTSIKDNLFLEEIFNFYWLKEFNKSALGICAGMQVVGLMFSGKLSKKKKLEIGFYNEKFNKEFLGLKDQKEVYHLHKNYVDFPEDKFEIFSKSGKIVQAVKHKDKEIYGCLFHPEVRNKEVIEKFALKK